MYCAACPGSPPEAGLLTARAHPPDARAVTYIYGYPQDFVENVTNRALSGSFRAFIHRREVPSLVQVARVLQARGHEHSTLSLHHRRCHR